MCAVPYHVRVGKVICCGWLIWIGVGSDVVGQTSTVTLPTQPPANGIFLAGAGNQFFDLHQSAGVSAALMDFSRETEIRVCLVLMNSPSEPVFENMRQQARIQWCERYPCMVIFYDFDTRLLAVQTSPTYRDGEGNLVSNVFDAMAEEAWIGWIDQWMTQREQQAGLDVSLLGEFVRDYLQYLRVLWTQQEKFRSGQFPLLGTLAVAGLLGFVIFLLMQTRMLSQKTWYFPVTEIRPRLKARYGSGLMSVHHFSAEDSPNRSTSRSNS